MKNLKRTMVTVLSIPAVLVAMLLSLLPFRVIRGFNPFVFFVIYRLLGYRKNVVLDNLGKAFPKKSEADRLRIARGYYQHLADLILDTIGFMSIRKSTIKKLGFFEKGSREVIDSYRAKNKSFVLAMSHYGSWEVLGAVFNQNYPGYAVAGFRPLTNKAVDLVIHHSRKRLNNLLVPMKKLGRKTIEMVNQHQPFALMLISDQWPPPKTATIVDFLGIETPFYNGLEKLSRKFDLPVVFISTRKKDDGTYSIFVEEITNSPKNFSHGDITRKYAELLQNEIKTRPEYWLWSHRRWKEAK